MPEILQTLFFPDTVYLKGIGIVMISEGARAEGRGKQERRENGRERDGGRRRGDKGRGIKGRREGKEGRRRGREREMEGTLVSAVISNSRCLYAYSRYMLTGYRTLSGAVRCLSGGRLDCTDDVVYCVDNDVQLARTALSTSRDRVT